MKWGTLQMTLNGPKFSKRSGILVPFNFGKQVFRKHCMVREFGEHVGNLIYIGWRNLKRAFTLLVGKQTHCLEG